jgi:hypothetical protein
MNVNIYELIDPRSNSPRYIGRTVGDIERRLSNHISEARAAISKSHRVNWINELLKLNLKPIIQLVAVVDKNEWDIWEIFYIQLYKDLGYSLVNGSNGGDGFAPNNIPWNKGKSTSEETKQKIRDKRKLQNITEETKQKMSDIKKGIRPSYMTNGHVPEEVKQKISNSLKGNIPWNKGKCGYSTNKKGFKMSEEQKIKMSKARKGKPLIKKRRPINQYDKDMNLINSFNSISEASKQTGIPGINNAATGRSKTAGGYIWQ